METFGTSLKMLTDGKQMAMCHMGFRFDSYMGNCSHDCLYCYARGQNMRYKRWDSVKIADLDDVKKRFENVIVRGKNETVEQRAIHHRYPIRMGTQIDCFQEPEREHGISYKFIDEIMNKYNYPYVICTKNKMVAEDKYLELYKDKGNVAFQFTLSTMDQKFLDVVENGASTAIERVETMKKLSDLGYHVTVRISPIIPEYNTDVVELIETLAKNGVKHIICEVLRITSILNKLFIEKLDFDVIDHYKKMGVKAGGGGYFRYPLLKKIKFQKYIKELCDKNGMTFATCGDEDISFHTCEMCCGLDNEKKFQGYPKSTYVKAYHLCEQNGRVGLDEFLDGDYCSDPKTMKKVWNEGYFENILKNLQFNEQTKEYEWVECNPTLKKQNSQVDEEHGWF